MGVHDLAISTNHPFNTYSSGQSIRGKVHFALDTPQSIRGVYVKFGGIAQVKWTEPKEKIVHGDSRTTNVRYYGEHEYFDEKIYLIGEAKGEPFELKPGNYNYKFEYVLPVALPSSYEGVFGGIFYNITAGLDKPWTVDDEETVRLQIRSTLDLNTIPQLKGPGYIKCTKKLCCLWCKSGPLMMEIHIPKTGYTNGEIIDVKADVENLTHSIVTKLDFELKQIISFHSEFPQHHTKTTDKTLCLVEVERGVPDRSIRSYNEKLEIPEHSALYFNNCDLMDVEYELKIEAHIDGCHSNLSGKIPIKMGAIPINFDRSTMQPTSLLTGYGTPYPYETEPANITQNTYNQTTTYGWMPCSKAT